MNAIAGLFSLPNRFKQFRRLKRVIKRQRTILAIVIREVQRKRALLDEGLMAAKAWSELSMWLKVQIKALVVDLGFRGVDEDTPGKLIIHRGKLKNLCPQQKAWLRRRQAIEPAISCAAGYNLRWLLPSRGQAGPWTHFLRLLQALLHLTRPPLASYSTYSTR